MRKALLAVLLMAFAASALFAGEPVRRVQEELRKRNLFFGDVDGKISPELIGAVRVYQARKGFAPNGEIDQVTCRSLGVDDIGNTGARAVSSRTDWPDVPVLRSDAARQLPPEDRAVLEKQAAANVDASSSPEITAAVPNESEDLDEKRVTKFVDEYLRAAATNDLAAQTRFYGDQVAYFDHGVVEKKFIEMDTARYLRRWPERQYQLTAPVKVAAGAKKSETVVEFPIFFHVRSKTRAATGKTRNMWTIRSEGEALKIVAIREEHLHE
jgi:peptidoglycan hydrolase-like protein with peptidoglycan-binding domain